MSVIKVTDLAESTSLTDDDLFMVVDSPSGTPSSKKITASNVKSFTSIGRDTYHGVESVGTISFDAGTHVVSVSAITYWYQGVQYVTSSPTTCDLDLTAYRDHVSATLTANTLYYVYFKDATGKLYWSPSFWNLQTTVPVATLFWNGSAGAVSKETHGYSRNIDWHIWAHLTIGARYGSGLDKTYPTAAVDASLQIDAGTIYDEDISISIGQQTIMRGYYKASAGTYTFSDYALPYTGTTGAPTYLDTDTYTLTTFASNKYICYWVFATADQDRPIAIIPSHVSAPYSQAADARVEVQPSVSGANPEWKLIYRWIYSGDGQFVESADYRLQTSIAGGVSASTNAGAVSFTPAGNVAATNVQTAIEELDSEKAPNLLTGFTSGAGTITATDTVLQAIQKLDGNVGEGTGTVSSLFEVDIDGGLMPVTDNLTDDYFELDVNDDIQPIAA